MKKSCLVGVALLLVCVLLVCAQEEEDSDIEYDTPQSKPPVTRRTVDRRPKQHRRAKQASGGSKEDSDDLGEQSDDLGQEGDEQEKQEEAGKEQIPMVRRYEKQEHFFYEAIYLTVVVFAIFTYVSGKTANTEITQLWLTQYIGLLRDNFTNVGDSGNFEEPTSDDQKDKKDSDSDNEEEGEEEEEQQPRTVVRPTVVRDSPSNLSIFCSGRRNCVSVLFNFELCSRQDLLAVVYNVFTKNKDELTITVEFGDRDMTAPLSFAVVSNRAHKEFKDIHDDLRKCGVTKPGQRGLPSQFVLISEAESAAFEVLGQTAVKEALHNKWFKSLHVTDHSSLKQCRSKKVMQLKCFLPTQKEKMGEISPILKLALHLVDVLATTRLGDRESRAVRQFRDSAQEERRKLERQQLEEEVLRKKAEQRKREREQREATLDNMAPEARRKAEAKMQRQEAKKKNSGKQKMQFFSL